MSCLVIVRAPSPAIKGGARTLASHQADGPKAARAFVRTNRETWRAALEADEARFIAVLLDGRSRPIEAIEFDRTWGAEGVTHAPTTVRSMMRALRNDLKTLEEKA